MCIPFQNMVPPTEAAKKCVNHMKMIAAIEVVVAMLKMFVFQNIWAGLYELISCMILWMGWAQLSYCICLLYIVYICIIGSISYFVNLITPIQNGMSFFGNSGQDKACTILTIIFLIFYSVAAYLVFQAYKEFKAVQYEIGGAGNGFLNGSGGGGGQSIGGAQYSQGQGQNNYGANANYGGNGAGDQEAYIPPSRPTNVSTNPSSTSTTSQQYFTGKGVRIG